MKHLNKKMYNICNTTLIKPKLNEFFAFGRLMPITATPENILKDREYISDMDKVLGHFVCGYIGTFNLHLIASCCFALFLFIIYQKRTQF